MTGKIDTRLFLYARFQISQCQFHESLKPTSSCVRGRARPCRHGAGVGVGNGASTLQGPTQKIDISSFEKRDSK